MDGTIIGGIGGIGGTSGAALLCGGDRRPPVRRIAEGTPTAVAAFLGLGALALASPWAAAPALVGGALLARERRRWRAAPALRPRDGGWLQLGNASHDGREVWLARGDVERHIMLVGDGRAEAMAVLASGAMARGGGFVWIAASGDGARTADGVRGLCAAHGRTLDVSFADPAAGAPERAIAAARAAASGGACGMVVVGGEPGDARAAASALVRAAVEGAADARPGTPRLVLVDGAARCVGADIRDLCSAATAAGVGLVLAERDVGTLAGADGAVAASVGTMAFAPGGAGTFLVRGERLVRTDLPRPGDGARPTGSLSADLLALPPVALLAASGWALAQGGAVPGALAAAALALAGAWAALRRRPLESRRQVVPPREDARP